MSVPVLVDANFIIDILRGEPAAIARAEAFDREGEQKVLPTPVVYEIATGLLYRRSRSEAARFRAIAQRFDVASFDEVAAMKAAEIQAELMRIGALKGAVDVMIAGQAAAHGLTLVTRDKDLLSVADQVGLATVTY